MEEYRENPFWRRKGMSTSAMVEEISGMRSRYENLGAPEKDWAARRYSPGATTEWLFQVNKIEGEGFDTLEETQQAIHKDGVLEMEMHDDCDERIKNVWGLNQALVPWFFGQGEEKFGSGGIGLLLDSHKSMFCFTRPSIAGRIRSLSEIVYVDNKDGKHFFMRPERIDSALRGLMRKTSRDLGRILSSSRSQDKTTKLLKLGGRFFFQYESIHPFVDGNGRTGRIMLAHILQSVTMVSPNVLLVDKAGGSWRKAPDFVDRDDYLECFRIAQGSVDEVPRDITAMVIEGVYVGWKRFFGALQDAFPSIRVERRLDHAHSRDEDDRPRKRRRKK